PIAKVPGVFAPSPGARAPIGYTFFRAFTGAETAFPPAPAPKKGKPRLGGLKLADIKDGTSNTLLVVEASEAVPWTKPEELPYDPKRPLPRLGTRPGSFLALFCDGSVRYLRTTLPERTLRALITASGGKEVGKLD